MSITKVTYSMIKDAAINVQDFGADATGVNDSAAAIQNAIDSGTNNVLFFPPGTYKISETIDVTNNNLVFLGNKQATIVCASVFTGTQMFDLDAEKITFDGLILNGLNSTTNGITLSAGTCDGLTVKNCEVFNCGYGIAANNNSNILIEYNYVHDCDEYSIWCQTTDATIDSQNISIKDNLVDTTHLDPATATELCTLVRGYSTAVPIRNVKVLNNTFMMPLNPVNSSLVGCEFRYVFGGVFSNNYSLYGSMLVSVAISRNVTVDGNVCEVAKFYGVEVAAECFEVIVSNNSINGANILKEGIALQGVGASARCAVSGNNIQNVTDNGIFVYEEWDAVSITGNTIYMSTANSDYGIYLFGNANNSVVSGNNLDGASVAKKGIYVIDSSYVSITGNTIRDFTQHGVLINAGTVLVDIVSITGNVIKLTSNTLPDIEVTASGSGSLGTNITAYSNPDYRITNTIGVNALDLANNRYQAWGSIATPEGFVTANVGSIFTTSNGGASTTLWVKTSGSGNTGWTGK
jgi:putative cofactor-binding repeat protein